jgi:predicted transcriptional regulator of viral defense system
MSTSYQTSSQQRFQRIAQLNEKVFHIDDLARIWQISSTNTLRVTIHRYIKKGWLFRIYRGFYSIVPFKKLDPLFLGVKALHQFAYVSTESILFEAGIIMQIPSRITLVSSESRQFTIGNYEYQSRKLQDRFLFNSLGINDSNEFKKAGIERAIADLIYYNSKYYFDNFSIIDWKKVNELQENIGYPITNYNNKTGEIK